MENATPRKSKKRILPIILGLVLAVAIFFSIKEYLYFQTHVDTDDAQIDGDISPVVARVGGYVNEIRFQDNQRVNKGDTLVVLDDRDYKIKVEQAEAALGATEQTVDVSRFNVIATQANIATAKANIEAAKAKWWKATEDFKRFENLYNDHAITKAQYDAAKAEKDAAQAALEGAESQYTVIVKQVGATQQQVSATASNLSVRRADLDYARLQLSYTVITAPVSGIVSKRNIQPGQLVQAGQTLFSIVNDSSIYVTANFKETQMKNLRQGDKVDIIVDAYPSQKLTGVIDNFAGATGAKFSLLPPDNATGNFVKVVQRIPVKIMLNADQTFLSQLRPGMSVKVSVRVK